MRTLGILLGMVIVVMIFVVVLFDVEDTSIYGDTQTSSINYSDPDFFENVDIVTVRVENDYWLYVTDGEANDSVFITDGVDGKDGKDTLY